MDARSQTNTGANGLDTDQVADKYNVDVQTTHVGRHASDASDSSVGKLSSESGRWKKSFFRLGPLAGIFCCLLAIASIIAALGVLMGSRDMATSSWSIPPSTYLAICTAIANQALRFAAFQGLAVAWWVRAMRGGTLAQLHRNWRAGITVGGAIISGRNMGLIGVACLASTLVAIDGPLLQKATTIDQAPIVAPPVTLNVTMAQELPHNLNGGWYPVTDPTTRQSYNFNATIPTVNGHTTNMIGLQSSTGNFGIRWMTGAPPLQVVHGCPRDNTCKTSIKAPALAVTACKSDVIPVDYWQHLKAPQNVLQFTDVAPPLSTLAFMVDISLVVDEENEYINLIVGYGRNENCTGTLTTRTCSLHSAIGEYDILVSGDKVEIMPGRPRIVALANNTEVSHKWSQKNDDHPSTLGGVAFLAWQKLETMHNYLVDHESTPIGIGFGIGYDQFTALGASNGTCFSYRDPFEDTLSELNKLMFELGTSTGIGKNAIGKEGNKSPVCRLMNATLFHLEDHN